MNYPSSPFFQRTLRGLCALVLVLASGLVQAQKFAYIDSDYVLLHMPEYATAQTELNNFAIQWQSDIESKLEAADRLEVAYRAERVLLTAEMRVKREEEISKKRAEAKDMQKQKFGVDGELFQKRQELIEPVQQQIFESLKDIASGSGYMVIFDKSNQSNMLYTNPKYDISDRLIKKLGYVPGETVTPEGGSGEENGKGGGSLMDRGRDAVNGAKDNARDRMNSAVKGGSGGRGTSPTSRPKGKN
jgi:outer membrane protein